MTTSLTTTTSADARVIDLAARRALRTADYTSTGRQQRDPLPLNDLDRAGRKLIVEHGARRALRDGLEMLAVRELAELTQIAFLGDDQAFSRRLRVIASGSLRASIDNNDRYLLDKAHAAKAIELAGLRELQLALLGRDLPSAA